MTARVIHSDCLDAMREMPDACVDAIVTDPPYGLVANKKGGSGIASVNLDTPYGRARDGTGNGSGGFMGKAWDSCVPGVEFWIEALRVAKPGAHLVAFGGTRTYHRLACAIEDAGWEVRDCLSWLYGSGFPKSLDVSKAIDKAAGAEREVVGYQRLTGTAAIGGDTGRASVAASGGTSVGAVKMSPLTAPATDAARAWQGWGTALKPAWEPIILARKPLVGTVAANVLAHGTGAINVDACRIAGKLDGDPHRFAKTDGGTFAQFTDHAPVVRTEGRWPANVALDEAAAAMLGEPARFFYTAKASRSERGEGNNHPTVKSLSLMRWLVRLVTPKVGVVLDPFCGSGTTLVAAIEEGFDCIGVEREAEYVAIIEARVAAAQQRPQFVAKPKPKRQPVKVQPAATAPPAHTASTPLPGQLALAWGAE